MVLFSLLAFLPQFARADYVGELETTKYFDQPTINLIMTRLAQGTGLLTGDQISYFIQFTPTNNGGMVGGGGFVTDYIPAGTQVTNAQFVRLNSNGTYVQIAPPAVAAMLPAYVPEYSETGIFYSTDPRTAQWPAGVAITAANGKILAAGGCNGVSLPSTTHNLWDSAMQTLYAAAARNATGTCIAPPVVNYSVMGASPVAGPHTFLKLDSTGVVGPWQRIAYSGSMYGTATGVASYGSTNKCIGGTPINSGYALSAANPLPINTNAVRFAAGKATVGELFSVRISLKLTANMPVGGIINNSEVFGGDASLDPGSAAGKDNHWKYHCPAVSVANSNLLLVKTLVGACTGAACIPTAIMAGVVPAIANLKLRYQIQYVNSSASTQTAVILTDKLTTGGVYVAGSFLQMSGTAIGTAPTGTTVLSFTPVAGSTLGPAAQGVIQYDVNFAIPPANNAALINTANLISTQVPAGVTSSAIATASTAGNLWLTKNTTPSNVSVAPGNPVAYTINISNNGGGAIAATATLPITVNDFLPTSGVSIAMADRFSYTAASVVARTWTAVGLATVVTPTVTVITPATAAAREQVTFKFTAATIPVGGKMTISYNAIAGANVPASVTPYLSDANVWYSGGPGGAALNSSYSEDIGTAPVIVTAPMSLVATVDCVYAGVTCVPYTNGTISPGSKIKYKLSYANANSVTINGVVLTDTLPANTSFVTGTAKRDGTAIADPSVAGQVLTFPSFTSPGVSNGYISFDVQLASVTAGTDMLNTGKITAPSFPAGVTASVTTSVRNGANLLVTKTVTPSTIALGGTVTYTITVSNTGDVAASGIKIYDELPFTGTTADATRRFNFNAGTSVFATTDTAANKLLAVTPTTSVPPTFAGYTGNVNQQEILWTFAPAKELAAGKSFTLTYTATAGSAVTSKHTPYTSDVQAEYLSSTSTLYASTTNTAPVTIPSNLSITTTIDCVYEGAVCNAYNPADGYVPADAKIRYKTHYTATVAQTNVYICNQLPTQTGTFVAAVSTPAVAPTPTGAYLDSPALGTRVSPAHALCGLNVGSVSFSYPVISSLAANAGGDVYFDVQTVGAAQGDIVSNTGKIVSASAPTGETSVSSVFVSLLQISKTTSTASVGQGGKATYTVEISNTSATVSATNFKLYDFLPTSGGIDATTNFTYDTGSAAFTAATTWPTGGMSAAPALSNPPTLTAFSYNAATNMQQLLWDFTGKTLLPGGKIFITYTATVGSAVPLSGALYGSDLYLEYANPLHEVNVAPVTVILPLDHYELRLPSTGISCMPTTVTVIACSDSSSPCAAGKGATTVSGKTVTLAASAGTLGATTLTFNASGTATTTLSYPTATDGSNGTATANTSNVTISGASTAASTGYQCCPDGISCSASNVTSCTSTTMFAREGFIISSARDGSVVTIPTQKAGVSDATYYLRAVKKGSTGATANLCVSALSGAQNVSFAYECNDPVTCASSDLMAVNGGASTVIARNNNGAFTSYWLGPNFASVSMMFDSNGNAPFTFVYNDVGKVTLQARFTNSSGGKLEGSTNSFIVSPHHFAVDVCTAATAGDCPLGTAATPVDGTGTVLAKASATFKATVRAMPATGTVSTPSFSTAGSASSGTTQNTENAVLTYACVAPFIGTATNCPGTGAMSGTNSFARSTFTSGIKTVSDLTWSEVGVITLTADTTAFMGGALATTGVSSNAGRFTPDHFDIVATGTMAPCATGLTCTAPRVTTMVYSGQTFASAKVTAMNAEATPVATRNYQGAFARNVTLTAVDSAGAAVNGILTVPNPSIAKAKFDVNKDGSATVSGDGVAPFFTLAVAAPAPSPLDVYLHAIDGDAGSTSGAGEGGVKVVSGRVTMSNVYGSELLPLTLTAIAQYYDTTGNWVISANDNVTRLMSLALPTFYPVGATGTTIPTFTPVTGLLSGGVMSINLARPTGGAGKTTVTPTALPSYLPFTSGTATFGVYISTSTFIYHGRHGR